MKTATINQITYTQAEEKEAGSCKGCVAHNHWHEENEAKDKLCDKLSLVVKGECEGFIWEEEK